MKKLLIVLFLIMDLAVISAAGGFLFFYVQGQPVPYLADVLPPSAMKSLNQSRHVPVAIPVRPSAVVPLALPVVSPAVMPPVTPTPALPFATTPVPIEDKNSTPSGHRNIRFTYKNPKAKEVFIRADFTGWKGTPMVKDAAGNWNYDSQLPPGEYAYCFAVDSKIIADPASKRFKKIGATKVSAIVVTPAGDK